MSNAKKRAPYKKVTLADVAREAHVSPTTVSRAINNPHLVDGVTYEKIRNAMEQLGYVYSKGSGGARGISGAQVLPMSGGVREISGARGSSGNQLYPITSKKGIVALMIPNDENPFYMTFMNLMEKALERAGYMLMLCMFNNEVSSIEAHMENLIRQNVAGCIMAYIRPDETSPVFERFRRAIPCVAFQSDLDAVDQVEAEEGSGTYEMLKQLVRFGHEKIAFVGYYSNIAAYEERFGAYRKVLEENQIQFRPEYVSEGLATQAMDFQMSYREGCRLLSLPDRPTAIHCFNLKSAMGVYVAIRDNRLRIPEDISLTAFDDLQVAQIFTPPLSVVGVPLQAMVSAAVDFLIARIERTATSEDRSENEAEFQRIAFPSTTHIRGSIGPVPRSGTSTEPMS